VKVGESRRKSVKVGDEENVFLSMISGNPFLSDFKLVKKPVCFGSQYNYKLDTFVKKSFMKTRQKLKGVYQMFYSIGPRVNVIKIQL
jgi:hypothetical protein